MSLQDQQEYITTARILAYFHFSSPFNVSLMFLRRLFHRIAGNMARVTVPSENPLGPCPAVCYGDPKAGTPAIVVMQEWWGMNQYILDTAKTISQRSSMVTLVPDIYRGKVAEDRETAGHYSADLNWSGAVADVEACIKYLKQEGCPKVGITGFCQGGAMTIAVAILSDNVDAAVPFYGIPNKSGLDLDYGKLSCPIQGHFGEEDPIVGLSSPADYNALKEKLAGLGKDFELFTYPAGHAFTNSGSPTFNKEAYELSYTRMLEFFQKHLK